MTMLGLGCLILRQAQEAFDNGRLEEAHRLLTQPQAVGLKGSSPLLRQVAQALVERGQNHLKHDDPTAAWNDLLQAEQIGSADTEAARLRQALTRLGLDETRKLLEAGEPGRAIEAIKQLRQGGIQQADVQLLEEAGKGWNLARSLAGRGEFVLAIETIDRVATLLSRPPASLERFRQDLHQRQHAFAGLLVQLHESVLEQRWRDVAVLAEQALTLAPQHAEARKARTRAWKAIEPTTRASMIRRVEDPSDEDENRQRFLLWIDGVGGYLVCLGSRVTLGQAAPDALVDIALFADIARRHAVLTRDPEGYVLEAVRAVQVNGRPVEKTLLQPGDSITLGASCRLQFRQPVPVSATARLDLTSGHRLPLAVDGVLLMADTLVLGPSDQAHVVMPDLKQPVVLYRHRDGLGIRYAGTLMIDGQACRERGLVGPASRVTGDEFAFAVESVSARIGGI